jgi:hypothetical protein
VICEDWKALKIIVKSLPTSKVSLSFKTKKEIKEIKLMPLNMIALGQVISDYNN